MAIFYLYNVFSETKDLAVAIGDTSTSAPVVDVGTDGASLLTDSRYVKY